MGETVPDGPCVSGPGDCVIVAAAPKNDGSIVSAIPKSKFARLCEPFMIGAGCVLIASACDQKPNPNAVQREAVATVVAGQWQGHSEQGQVEVVLAVSPDGRYEWKQTARGARKPHLAHTGQWTPADATDPTAEAIELRLSCTTIHFDDSATLTPGSYSVTYTITDTEGAYRIESPWGAFRIERVPEA